MINEYAVEPRALASSWENFRYVIEKFGFDRGRLIARYPKKWDKAVYDAAAGFPPMAKKRLEIALRKAKTDKIVKSGRAYDEAIGAWLENALSENGRSPFHAILALENRASDEAVITVGDVDETHPLMAAPRDLAVPRDASSLAQVMSPLLRHCRRLVFVDPYYDPGETKYQNVLRECLDVVKVENPTADIQIHYRDHASKIPAALIESNAPRLFRNIIPDGLSIALYCWEEKRGGEDFHDRYLLTDKCGLQFGAGLSAEGSEQTVNVHLLECTFAQEKLNAFDQNAEVYELVEPVLRIHGDGRTERV